MTEIVTACTMDCPDSCSLLVIKRKNGTIRLRGNPNHPFTAGFTCAKIKHHISRLTAPDRILTPLLKTRSGFTPLSWDDALDLCAEKFQTLRQKPETILHLPGEGAKGVLKHAVRLFFNRLGTVRVRGSLCDAAGFMAFVHDFGSRENNAPEDLLNARRIVNWGKDLTRSSVHLAAIVKNARKNGTQVLTVSPGGDSADRFSDRLVRVRPGGDRFLCAAVLRRMIRQNTVNPAAIERSRHWETFRKLILSHSEEDLLRRCDADAADLDALYGAYTDTGPTATIVGAGIQRYTRGGETVRFINALAMAGGHIGRTGGGSCFHLHSMGAFNLDWSRPPSPKSRKSVHEATAGRDILAADPPIEFIWTNGINIVNQAPNSRQIAAAFTAVPFKVTVEAFMTDTAEMADLILPTTLMLEQEDVVASFLHPYVQYARAALPSPAGAKTDHWIVRELGHRLYPPILIPDAETCLEASLKSDFLDTRLDVLRAGGPVKTRKPTVAYADLKFDHPDGKYRFPTALHPEPAPPDGYPLRFLSLIRREAIHSQIPVSGQRMPPMAWIAPDCSAWRDIDPNRPVDLVSPLGRLRVKLSVLEGLHPDAVVYRRGDWMKLGGGANQLIAEGLTDLGGGAPYYQQFVRLENGD